MALEPVGGSSLLLFFLKKKKSKVHKKKFHQPSKYFGSASLHFMNKKHVLEQENSICHLRKMSKRSLGPEK